MDSYHQSQFVPHRDEIAYTSATIPLRRVGEDGDGSPVERRQRRSDSDASSDFGTGANMHESRRTHATKLAWLGETVLSGNKENAYTGCRYTSGFSILGA